VTRKSETKAAGLCLGGEMRRKVAGSRRTKILEENNYQCVYCGDPAQEVDHIFPYSYTGDNTNENLVASCSICNRIAGSQVFDGFIEKQTYIREEREKPHHKKAIEEYLGLCSSAGLPIYKAKRTKVEPKEQEKEVKPKKKPQKPKEKLPPKSQPKPIIETKTKVKPKKKPARRKPKPSWTQLAEIETENKALKARINNLEYSIRKMEDDETKELIDNRRKYYHVEPAFDYSNLKAWQVLFQVKHHKEGTYTKVAEQYGLELLDVSDIADGRKPSDEAIEKLKAYNLQVD
jgi:hypothetical protein